MATVAANKTVSFRSPYTGNTFQRLAGSILGRDGYLSGGLTKVEILTLPAIPPAIPTPNPYVVVAPLQFVQRGIVVETTATATIPASLLPTDRPCYVVASVADDDPVTGAQVIVTTDLAQAQAGVVIATGNVGTNIWTQAPSVSVAAAAQRDSDTGVEVDVGVFDNRNPATGVVDNIDLYKGLLVDPSGERRELQSGTFGAVLNSSLAFQQPPLLPSNFYDRTDRVVLRQTEGFSPRIEQVMGGAIGSAQSYSTLASGAAVTRPSYFATRGGLSSQQWLAWGDGTDLWLANGSFGILSLYTGSSITSVWMVGPRLDGALVILFVDGPDLKIISFDATTGALVDAPVTLDALAGQISHVRAVADPDDRTDLVHVVFEHDEGAIQQIYYAKTSMAAATFGATVGPTQISDGVSNCTWPSLGINRQGIATVAWINGSGSNEFGQLAVATVDPTGAVLTLEYCTGSHVGFDVGAGSVSAPLLPGKGATQVSFLNFRKPAVAVTPHDEVYVFVVGLQSGTDPNHLLVYGPNFLQDHGFKLLNAYTNVSQSAGNSIGALTAECGESGEVVVAYKEDSATTSTFWAATFGTPLFKSGKIQNSLNWQDLDSGSLDSFNDLHLRKGRAGEFALLYMLGIDSRAQTLAPYGASGGIGQNFGSYQGHPRDLTLGSWAVPKQPSAASLNGEGKRFEVFNTRSKKMSYPVVVGKNGDYRGFDGISSAIQEVKRMGGGDVVLRNGVHHNPFGRMTLPSGVAIRGEGSATIINDKTTGLFGFDPTPPTSVSIVGNVVSVSSIFDQVSPGDIVELNTSGRHVVLRNLGYSSPSTVRLLLEDSPAGAPVGTTIIPYYSGVRLENLSIVQQGTPAGVQPIVELGYSNRLLLRNLSISGPLATVNAIAVRITLAIDPCIDGLDLSGMNNTDAHRSIDLSNCDGAVIRNVKLADGKGKLYVADTAQNVHLIHCSSDGADATKVIYDIAGTRTTPVFMTGCEGRISTTSLGQLITNVGKRVRLPEGGGAIALEDDNTRASSDPTVAASGISLTSTAHKEFDGATKDVVTAAVNERIKASGDAMEGPLELRSADYYADVGLQTLIDRTGQLTRLGEYFLDDFHRDPTATGSGWIAENLGGTSPFYAILNNHKLILNTVAFSGSNEYAALYRSSPLLAWADKPMFRARVNLAPGSTPFQFIGFASPSSPPFSPQYSFGFLVENLPTTKLVVFGRDASLGPPGFSWSDTMIAPPSGYFWYQIFWKGPNEFYWKITSDLNPSTVPLASNTFTPTSPVLSAANLCPAFVTGDRTAPTVSSSMLIDVVEVWTSTRSV